MSEQERTTGATPEQIEAAWERRQQRWAEEGLNNLAQSPIIARQMLTNTATDLVPSGYVIALAADVLTADQRAAIGRMTEMTAAWMHLKSVQKKNARRGASQEACDEVNAAGYAWQRRYDAITDDDIAVLRAIANGGTDE